MLLCWIYLDSLMKVLAASYFYQKNSKVIRFFIFYFLRKQKEMKKKVSEIGWRSRIQELQYISGESLEHEFSLLIIKFGISMWDK